MATTNTINIPTMLTMIRLILSPLLLPVLLVYLLPINSPVLNGLLALLFVFFGLTDFFDGYLARKYKQETALGRVLDPIADKFLVYSTLIALLTVHKIYFYWVIILIGREIFMMGLRQIALEYGIQAHVSFFGKLKTAAQIAMLTIMIANPYQQLPLCDARLWNGTQLALLIITLALSVISAFFYYQAFMIEFTQKTRSTAQENKGS